MVTPIKPADVDVVLKFGGGLHTRASEDETNERDAFDGQNFLLDLENTEFRPRPPFDLILTAPNASEIRGGGTLLKSDGTVSTIVQAGNTVYEWDGGTTFSNIGTVNANSKLRGHWRSHNFTLNDTLILTDLTLNDVVKQWNGTTFQSTVFTDENSAAFGTFYAKYLGISNERAVFYNVKDPGATTPHMIVGSLRGDYTQITITDRPSSALNEQDPFFLLAPDLKPINGHVEAFGSTIISTEKGKLFNLTGSSAKDFAFADFYPGSAASGDEAIEYIGNDIIYGRQGRLESIKDTDRFGDSEADDISRGISDRISGYSGWRLIYNSRLNRAYCFPDGISEVWVYNTAMRNGKLSPWMKWVTAHPLAFKPTFVMSMLDPSDSLEYVFMGDSSGNWYRLEGSGANGDAGSNEITTSRTSKLFSGKLDAIVYDVEGYLAYHKSEASTVSITFQFGGTTAFDESITISIPAISNRPVFSGGLYFSDGNYFGTPFDGRLIRQKYTVPGASNDFQVKIEVTGNESFRINALGVRLRQAS